MHRLCHGFFFVVIAGLILLGTQWIGSADAASPASLLTKSANPSESKPTAEEALPEDLSQDQIDGIMAGLSDEQVRQLLINELRSRASEESKEQEAEPVKGLLTKLMVQLDFIATLGSKRIVAVLNQLPNLPADFRHSLELLTDGKGIGRLFMMIFIAVALLIAGYLVELLERRLIARHRKGVSAIPTLSWGSKLGSTVIKSLPDFFGILVFALSSVIFYLIIYGAQQQPLRPLFLAALFAVLIARVLSAISRMLCSPNISKLRILDLSDGAAQRLHSALVRFFWIAAIHWNVRWEETFLSQKHGSAFDKFMQQVPRYIGCIANSEKATNQNTSES